MEKYKIFIIEDDKGIAENISNILNNYNLECVICDDFHNVIEQFNKCNPHLVLMDINLPSFDGYYYCSEIRKASSLPIIFVSAASDNMNIVMAMNMGGDDFITKPFDMSVLVAKVMASLRRAYQFNQANILTFNDLKLNISDNTLIYKEEKIELSKNEFRILLLLLENKGKLVSREKMMDALWQSGDFVDENTLNVNVNRLRKKLSVYGIENLITTRFGLGYIIEDKS